MYQSPNRTTGLDLLVLNVHRGRDHGIPRKFAGRLLFSLDADCQSRSLLLQLTFTTWTTASATK